jgi:lipoyl(octanoyl) transferase
LNHSRWRTGAAPAKLAAWQPERLSYNSSETLFAALDVYHDAMAYSAPMNMAVDEALLESAISPSIRFYRWQSPALSFGYFGRFGDVARYQTERDLVRRWTGGGIVFHGEDLTYSIVIPASDAAFPKSSMSVYETIHRALCAALAEMGQYAVVAGVEDPGRLSAGPTGISDTGYSCFANPVRADVMIDGRKVAGAAQRRTRGGLLQQGSIQGVNVGNSLAERFAEALSTSCDEREVDDAILNRAGVIAQEKYGTQNWLRRR